VSATPGPWAWHDAWGPSGKVNAARLRGAKGAVVLEPNVNTDVHLPNEADAHLIAAAPDLLRSVTVGAEVNLPDFLEWLADRMVNVYGESPNVDFVLTCRDRAKGVRAAIAKAEGR
jgi:hypothetical protein